MTPTSKKAVRVRFSPSPTGPFHIGSARTALFNWLFAKQNKGVFILRIEDTDVERSEKKYETDILESMHWLGLDWDEGPAFHESGENVGLWNGAYKGKYGPYRQSERKDIYKKYLEQLLADGHAYYCYCSKDELEAERQAMLSQGQPPKYGGHCRNLKIPPAGKKPEVIRFKTPEAVVEFKDIIRGKVAVNAALMGDIVIARDLNSALYNFTAVVDDELMEISHVIRGEDHLSNTPKQILLERALGFKDVIYAHLPLMLNPDRSKMSKRFGDTALSEYRKKGYLPETLINFLALLGWHPKDDREIVSVHKLIEEFDLTRVQKGGAIFNEEKLEWLQGEHLKNLSAEEISKKFLPLFREKNINASDELLKRIIKAERVRIRNFSVFVEEARFFFAVPDYDPKLLTWQKQPSSPEKITEILTEIIESLDGLAKEYASRDELAGSINEIIIAEGRGVVLWPLRVALSGQAASPDPIEIMEILGIVESKRRINEAIKKLNTVK